jgi:hypothetical protein
LPEEFVEDAHEDKKNDGKFVPIEEYRKNNLRKFWDMLDILPVQPKEGVDWNDF